jgi:hypothetical protein
MFLLFKHVADLRDLPASLEALARNLRFERVARGVNRLRAPT